MPPAARNQRIPLDVPRERGTAVDARPVTGTDRKISGIKGTRESGIDGNTVGDDRERVQRVRADGERRE